MNDGDEHGKLGRLCRFALIKKNIIIIINLVVLIHLENHYIIICIIFALSLIIIFMCTKKEKLKFVDSIVELLAIYCPQMSPEVSHFAACQFALESNFGKSRISQTCNNMCGMRVPIERLSNNKSSSGFASYESLIDCVVDYCYWLAWNHFGLVDLFNLDRFTRKLISKNYCPEKDYIDRIFTIYNELKSY